MHLLLHFIGFPRPVGRRLAGVAWAVGLLAASAAVVVDDRVALFGAPAIRARFEAVVEERRQALAVETGPSDGQRAAHPEEE